MGVLKTICSDSFPEFSVLQNCDKGTQKLVYLWEASFFLSSKIKILHKSTNSGRSKTSGQAKILIDEGDVQ